MKLKVFLIILSIAVVAVSLIFFLPPKITVTGAGILAISNTVMAAEATPNFDIVSISDIPAYGIIEPSGCGEFKGKVKIRFDMFMEPSAPYYDKCYVEVIDETSPAYLAGYKGELDKEGNPLDPDDYQKWLDSLPKVWRNNPFHSHFVYFDSAVTDEEIKAKLVGVTEYFYAFHFYCWDNDLTFLSQWVKVPKQARTMRDVFVAGDSSPPNKSACELKSAGIVSRLNDFDTRTFEQDGVPPTDLNIGEKGTIDIGTEAINRLSQTSTNYTQVLIENPANASGALDTVEVYCTGAVTVFSVATFYIVSGTTLSTRDYEDIGSLASGYHSLTGLSIDVTTDDMIGFVCSGSLERTDTSGLGYYYKSGDYIPCTSQSFTNVGATRTISLYGTGTEAGGEPDISNTPATWEIGTVATSTDYWSSGSAPTWPLDDGECAFTVTNNGDQCSITEKATNFTGGVGWTLASSAGENTVVFKAGKSGDANEGAMVTLTTSEQAFISGLAASATKKWELLLESATSHTDGAIKTSIVTLTATLD